VINSMIVGLPNCSVATAVRGGNAGAALPPMKLARGVDVGEKTAISRKARHTAATRQ
jgi:hypothetical protein